MAAAALALFLLQACQTDNSTQTESGYRYELIRDEPGEPAKEGDFAFFHVKMLADDSVMFDTRVTPGETQPEQIPSKDAPARGNMRPIYEVLSIMSPGDSLRLYFPVDSFPTPPPQLEGFNEVIYELVVTETRDARGYGEWLEQKKAEQAALAEAGRIRAEEVAQTVSAIYADYKSGKLKDQVTRLPSGLGIIVHEEGTGPIPQQGEVVSVNYYGILDADGSMFDNSYQRGTDFQFAVGMGEVIRGWDEGFSQLKVGSKATLLIPSELGYGDRGTGRIEPNSDLVFYVELLGIQ